MSQTLDEQLKQAKDDASVFIKMEKGESRKLHILTRAKVFSNIFFDTPPFPDAPKSMNIPFGSQIPGFKPRPQWAFEVVDVATGKHKILCAGATAVEQINAGDKAFRPKGKGDVEAAGYPLMDITLKRYPATPWWTATAGPTQYDGDRTPTLDMDAEIKMATADQLSKLTANRAPSQLKEGVSPSPSDKQVDFIDSLCKSKELTVKGLTGILQRKFSKDSLADLTGSEASVLIETLQGL